MSNQLVGSVYKKIIDLTVNQSQVPFEEEGINQQTLEELRTTWQTKLSNLHVASFPWEPAPAPPTPQPMANPTPVPSNVPKPLNVQSSGTSPPPTSNGAGSNVRIKSEPGSEYSQPPQYTGFAPNYENNEARARAAAHLGQRYGDVAASQINQLMGQSNNPHPAQRPSPAPGNIQLPQQPTEQQRREYAERQRQQQARQLQQSQQAQQQRPAVSSGQTDGADEWSEMVAQRRAAALADAGATREADLTMRQRLEQMSHAMEGGGFMIPLSERPKQPQPKKRKVTIPAASSSSHAALMAAQSDDPAQLKPIPQVDGFGDSDDEEKKIIKGEYDLGIKGESDLEDDEDAINSDLDDPDELVNAEEQDDGQEGQIMVCTYDKVARVKNKWKCTLKDGVLTTGGKEYVFHKANGEFEW